MLVFGQSPPSSKNQLLSFKACRISQYFLVCVHKITKPKTFALEFSKNR